MSTEDLCPLLESKPHRELRLRTSGIDLSQFSMLTRRQFESVMDFLAPGEGSRVLDVGCGVGRIAHEVYERSGAQVVAVDSMEDYMEVGMEAYGDRVEYLVLNYEDPTSLDGSFDCIYCIDSLYFTEKLHDVVEGLISRLKTGGRLAILWTQKIESGEQEETLLSDQTKLALVLKSLGIACEVECFTEEEIEYWKTFHKVLRELEQDLISDGYKELVEHLKWESDYFKEIVEDGRISRYLYKVSKT